MPSYGIFRCFSACVAARWHKVCGRPWRIRHGELMHHSDSDFTFISANASQITETWLFIQQFVQSDYKWNWKTSYNWPLWGESICRNMDKKVWVFYMRGLRNVANRRQDITWTNDDPYMSRIYESLSLNDLISSVRAVQKDARETKSLIELHVLQLSGLVLMDCFQSNILLSLPLKLLLWQQGEYM